MTAFSFINRYAATLAVALFILISATVVATPIVTTNTKGGGVGYVIINGRSVSAGSRVRVTTPLSTLAATLANVCKTDVHIDLTLDGGAEMPVSFTKQTVELLGYEGVIKLAIAQYENIAVSQVNLATIMIDTNDDWEVVLAAGCNSTGRYKTAQPVAYNSEAWTAENAMKQQGRNILLKGNETAAADRSLLIFSVSGQLLATLNPIGETNSEGFSAIKFELPNHLQGGVYVCSSKVGDTKITKLVTIF